MLAITARLSDTVDAVRAAGHPQPRCATVHLESAVPIGIMDLRDVPLFLAGQALSAIQGTCRTGLGANPG